MTAFTVFNFTAWDSTARAGLSDPRFATARTLVGFGLRTAFATLVLLFTGAAFFAASLVTFFFGATTFLAFTTFFLGAGFFLLVFFFVTAIFASFGEFGVGQLAGRNAEQAPRLHIKKQNSFIHSGTKEFLRGTTRF
ncbi:MAG: hypothetical protein Q7R47_02810, partial [Candidatus Diapherotrites archaeon]|nr:hypothetical protein [Candidatus Diapherotrites archaeon]